MISGVWLFRAGRLAQRRQVGDTCNGQPDVFITEAKPLNMTTYAEG